MCRQAGAFLFALLFLLVLYFAHLFLSFSSLSPSLFSSYPYSSSVLADPLGQLIVSDSHNGGGKINLAFERLLKTCSHVVSFYFRLQCAELLITRDRVRYQQCRYQRL